MKVLYNGKTVDIKNDLVLAITLEQNINAVKDWMGNYDLTININDLSRQELLEIYDMIDEKIWQESGEVECEVLEKLGLIE